MPFDKFVLLIVCVLAAAGLTVYLAASLLGDLRGGAGLAMLSIAALCAYVGSRIVAKRLDSRNDRTHR